MKTVTRTPLTSDFGQEIKGVHLSEEINPSLLTALSDSLIEHKVLLLRDQNLTAQQYADFGRQWSEATRIDSFTEMHHPDFEDINLIGNVGELFTDEGYRNGASFWHTDCAAEKDPNATTMLYCIHALKKHGETVFADMEAAYAALDEDMKNKIDSLIANHCYAGAKPILGGREDWEHTLTPVSTETQQSFPPPVTRPVVRSHTITNRKSLYAPAGSAFSIQGMEDIEAHHLMRELKLFATQKQFCYTHRYRPGDLIIWDNSSTMHYAKPVEAATGDEDRRLMYRISPLGLPAHLSSHS